VAAALAPYFTVYAYDRRGRGDSGDTAPYTVEREVEDLDAVLEVAGGSAFVFGHSSGAALALCAARALPSKILKMALYEPPFVVDDAHAPMPEDFPERLSALVASGSRSEAVERWMAFVGLPDAMIERMRQAPMWLGMEAIARSLVYDATVMRDTEQGSPEPLTQWASVTIPTLVMDGAVTRGREDAHTFMRHGAEALAHALPNARRLTLEGQDHGPSNEALVPALRAFFLD
jgi:pimeloyl-ACP methyl ester carboxylesterase